MSKIEYKDLLDAGVHFGHLTRKWDPRMSPYIFMEKNGIHIIDLNKTLACLEEASNAIKQIVRSGKKNHVCRYEKNKPKTLLLLKHSVSTCLT